MGVLGGPLGHLWESLRVPWGHLGSACGALAVLKIIEKPLVFSAMGDPWVTLERLWFVLWGRWVLFGGHWALLRSPRALLGGPLGILEGLGRRFGGPWGSLGGSQSAQTGKREVLTFQQPLWTWPAERIVIVYNLLFQYIKF